MNWAPQSPILPGYELVRELGVGGMGHVFEAFHHALRRRVAIKFIRAENAADPVHRTRFLREAQAVAHLDHPGVVKTFDFGQLPSGETYMISEFVAGESIKTVLKREAPLSIERAVDLLGQLADAVGFVHKHRVIHRDLKPSNILLTPSGGSERVKVLDFGLAKHSDEHPDSVDLTHTGQMLGTPGYMSPEQCDGGGDVDHRSDIYSLGVIGYEMLAGRPPFEGDGVGAVIAKHIYVEPEPIRTHNPAVPEALEWVILRCLEKSRGDRFDSMGEVADALRLSLNEPQPAPFPSGSLAQQVGATGSIPTPTDGTELMDAGAHQPGRGWPRWRAAAVATVIAGFVLGGLWAWGRSTRQPTPPRDRIAPASADVNLNAGQPATSSAPPSPQSAVPGVHSALGNHSTAVDGARDHPQPKTATPASARPNPDPAKTAQRKSEGADARAGRLTRDGGTRDRKHRAPTPIRARKQPTPRAKPERSKTREDYEVPVF